MLRTFANAFLIRSNSARSLAPQTFLSTLPYDKFPPVHGEHKLENFKELIKTDQDSEKIQRILSWYYKATLVPTKLSLEHMESMMLLPSARSCNRSFRYYFSKQCSALHKARRAESRAQFQHEQFLINGPPKEGIFSEDGRTPMYGMFNNAILSVTHTVSKPSYSNLINASLFGNPLILDFSYDDFMYQREQATLTQQVHNLISHNRTLASPFDIHFCNYHANKHFAPFLHSKFNVEDAQELLVTATRQSYLELFPQEKLVYLSPHAKEKFTHYDPNSIYIIGSFVDQPQYVKAQHSFVNATRSGIKTVKLPLDEYFKWGVGGKKELNVDHVAQMMMDMHQGLPVNEALERYVPRRKLRTPEEMALLHQRRKEKNQRMKTYRKEMNQEAASWFKSDGNAPQLSLSSERAGP